MKYNLKSLVISVLALVAGAISVSAQQLSDSVAVYFRQGESVFERDFRDNGTRLDDFIARVQLSQDLSHLKIWRVEYVASASPEGTEKINAGLAQKRASVLTSLLHSRLEFPDSLVHLRAITEDWEGLAARVKDDQNVPHRKEALKIIQKENSDRKQKLQKLAGGNTWNYLLRTHFPDLRSFRVYIYSDVDQSKLEGVVEVGLAAVPEEMTSQVPVEQPQIEQVPQEVPVAVEPAEQPMTKPAEQWSRKLTVKTNLLGAAFLMANAAVEVDIIENLSCALPVYWSGWDYAGINTLKFRTFMIQPELRYYIPKTNGLYVGAHFGVGHWNFALGDHAPMLGLDDLDGWRYQDHKGETPAIGGGLSLGYALQFKKNPRWGMEFAIGGGIYDAKYDVFYNEANGPYHERGIRTTYIGVDNASISFTYKFDLLRSAKNEKEGRR